MANMNIIDNATAQYQQNLEAQQAQDPLTQLAGQVGLKVNSPEAENKLRTMGQAVYQQGAKQAQIQQAGAVDKATTNYKQSFFQGVV